MNRHGQKLLMIGNFFNFDKNKKDDEDIAVSNKEEAKDLTKSSEYIESDDPVEKLFSFFFGEKEEKPMGLARFGANRFPGMFFIPPSFFILGWILQISGFLEYFFNDFFPFQIFVSIH